MPWKTHGSCREDATPSGVGATPRLPHGSVLLRLQVFCEARADATTPPPGLPEGSQKELSAKLGGILGGAVKFPGPLASAGAIRLGKANESVLVFIFNLRSKLS